MDLVFNVVVTGLLLWGLFALVRGTARKIKR